MRFQPGQSGNPAGRPPGARNKKTIAMEQELAERAQKAVGNIIFYAGRGHAVAMRIVAEWARPTGTNRSPALELPPITCADDAQAALQTVLEGFANGAISVRELPVVLGGVERAVRILDRIQQVRERERAGRQIRGELHPGMLPKPSGKPDPVVEALRAAGEEVPEYLASADAISRAAAKAPGLYPPVNSDAESSAAFAPEASSQAAAQAEETVDDGLHFPVNSSAEPPPGDDDEAPPSPASDGISGELQADAAVDDEFEAGDVPALVAREIDGSPGDVESVAAEAHGHLPGAGGDGGGLFGSREVHVRAEYLRAFAREGDGGGLAVAPAGPD